MRHTLLVDASSLYKRSHAVNGNHYTPEFGNISGVLLSLITLRTLAKQLAANKIVFVWDGQNNGKLRNNLVGNYKATRMHKSFTTKIILDEKDIRKEEANKESLLRTKICLQNILEELFIRQVMAHDEIEADDLISVYCKQYHEDEKITVYTGDVDLLQLLQYSDTIKVYLASKKSLICKDNYHLFFKHYYKNLAIVKTFCGDTSDNIYGVKGLGEDTLIKLFPEIKTQAIDIKFILERTEELINERTLTKKKPLLVLDNIKYGINGQDEELGISLYENNYKIINLLEPFVTKNDIHNLKEACELPLDEENRGSRNLIRIFDEIGFMQHWNGSLKSFCEPFYATILKEKSFSKKV
jgi:5'-3' exonuclease